MDTFLVVYNYIEIYSVYLLKINVYTLAVLGLRWLKKNWKIKEGSFNPEITILIFFWSAFGLFITRNQLLGSLLP